MRPPGVYPTRLTKRGLGYDGFAEATGADCIGLDPTVPLEWAAQKLIRGPAAVLDEHQHVQPLEPG